MQTVKPLEGNSLRTFWGRLRGAGEVELFGPRGKLPTRGEPDVSVKTTLLVLAGITVVGLVLRLAVTRGIWLDEAISIFQANLGLGDMFENLQGSDRNPPLHHIALWLTVHVLGDGEFAVRLPSMIAGTLVIPALYLLGRELYDRRTALIAAAFAAASPLLVWYSQEARMFAFVTLFGLLALYTQLRAIREGGLANWAAYILATSALLWSHYFGLLLILVQQVVFVGVIIHRKRAGEAISPIALGFAYSFAVLALQLVLLGVFAVEQYNSTGAGVGSSPSGTYEDLSFYAVVANVAWALWGYHPDGITELLAALWPLFLLVSLLLLGRGGSRQTLLLAAAVIVPIVLLLGAAFIDRELFEVRYFLVVVPLLLLLVARLVTGWLRKPTARYLVAGGVILTLLLGLADQQLNDDNPRLYDFDGATEEIQAAAGPQSLVVYEPPALRYVLDYYAPELPKEPLKDFDVEKSRESPLFVLASFQENQVFFDRTNKVVGTLSDDFFRGKPVQELETSQTKVWEFGKPNNPAP